MSYLAREASLHDGDAIELIEIRASEAVWRYCNRSTDFEWSGQIWEATPIRRSEIVHSSEITKAGISLYFPRGHEFAQNYFNAGADVVHTVTIWRGHLGEPDEEFQVYWKGRITAPKPERDQIVIECESIFTTMRRTGVRARFQRACRHTVYSRGCGLARESWRVLTQCTAADGLQLTVPGAASFADGYFAGGMLQTPDGVWRYIGTHQGAGIGLWRPVPDLVEALANTGYGRNFGRFYGGPVLVELYPGCPGDIDTCHNRFDNRDQYGGFIGIPRKNPMGGSSIV